MKSRIVVTFILIASLVCSTFVRLGTRKYNLAPDLGTNVQLGQFNSYTLGLLLGGLRGPLVMVLW
ncbi:MAG TPA: hypothetical protein PK402_14315, partial [Tepidisphaeraceae bacterium]|nr:hypothetical protein [Tepidisphaeraceae bacterium]